MFNGPVACLGGRLSNQPLLVTAMPEVGSFQCVADCHSVTYYNLLYSGPIALKLIS